MPSLYVTATEQRSLYKAWTIIRRNGLASSSEESRRAVERFDQNPVGHIRRIQSEIRNGTFEFDPQFGILKKSQVAVSGA